jgi:gliding motility-associated-like protein
MTKNLLNIILLYLIVQTCCLAQVVRMDSNCGQHDFNNYADSELPISQSLIDEAEKGYKKEVRQLTAFRSNDILTLPVVFHIIHNGGEENIADERVLNSLANLNLAFRNETIFNPETGIDTRLQFCLAQRDNLGSQISGILRYDNLLTDMSSQTSSLSSISELTNLPVQSYINIRIVKNACLGSDCGFSGFAINGNYTNSSGIIVEADMVGNSSMRDEVLIHEMGHFLGLKHTFDGSCENTDCLTDGDRVCDTPPDNHKGGHPCDLEFNSCESDEDDITTNNPYRSIELGGLGDQPDSEINYMDYSYFSCQSEFTQGQADRMRWFIDKHYQSLLDSKTCYPPCQNMVDISIGSNIDTDSISIGTEVIFDPVMSNTDSISWILNSEVISNNSFIWNPDIEGIYEVCLVGHASELACTNDTICQLINVYCNANAKFDFQLWDSTLTFQNCSSNYNDLTWELFYGLDNINISLEEIDSFILQIPGVYRLCLSASNEYCSDSHCIMVNYLGNGVEDCSNEFDDDNDGFVDLYDSDCTCLDNLFQSQCEIDCEIVPDEFPDLRLKLKWQSEILTSSAEFPLVVKRDDEVRVVASERIEVGELFGNPVYEYELKELSPYTGLEINSFDYRFDSATKKLSCRIENELYYFVPVGDTLYKFSNSTLIDKLYLERSFLFIPSLADINGDGVPEVIIGTTIINADNMTILAKGDDMQGCQDASYNECSRGRTIVGDYLPSSGLELAAGNIVYDIEINNLFGEPGNSMIAIQAMGDEFDGTTAAADFNGDGNLDIVVVQRNTFDFPGPFSTISNVTIWDPLTRNVIATRTADVYGTLFSLIDLDNDCIPEIICKGRDLISILKFDGISNISLENTIAIQDNSYSSMTAFFDLNYDGFYELIFRDQEQLCIINPLTGNNIDCYPVKSVTGSEYPVIADIDGDNAAEILISGYLDNEEESRLFCFESANIPWAPARSILNQYNYHPSMVNDDMTIPRNPQNPAAFFDTDSCALETCPQVYNYFGSQATYRTQNGCVQFPALDFVVSILENECSPDSSCIKFLVQNRSTKFLLTDSVKIYYGDFISQDPSVNYSLDSLTIHFGIADNGVISSISDTISICIPRNQPYDDQYLFIGVNDRGYGPFYSDEGNREFQECDYFNNYDSIRIFNFLPLIDLGPDIVGCINEPIVLKVSGDFESYLWSDFSTDSIYTASYIGTHSIEATDSCGKVYRDTLIISVDSALIVNIVEESFTRCIGEDFTLTVENYLDSVVWYPSNEVDCYSCNTVNIAIDSTTTFFAIGYSDGCESIDTVTVFVEEPIERTQLATICEGDSILFDGSYRKSSGIYNLIIGDCDSLIRLDLYVIPPEEEIVNRSFCEGDSVIIESEVFKEEGSFQINTLSTIGCDSIISLTVEFLLPTMKDSMITICYGDSILLDGNWYDDNEMIFVKDLNSLGCDSTTFFSIELVDILSDQETVNICEGDSMMLHGLWQSISGDYPDMFTSSSGCDSVFTYHLNVKDTASINLEETICQGDTFFINGQMFLEQTFYTFTMPSSTLCDSTVNLSLSVSELPTRLVDFPICEGDSVLLNDIWILEEGNYEIRELNENGCDSLLTYQITISEYLTNNLDIIRCEGDTVVLNDMTFTSDTILLDTITGVNCPTIRSRHISFAPPSETIMSIEYCQADTFVTSLDTLINTGTAQEIFTSSNGCDSIIIYDVTFIPRIIQNANYSICAGDSIFLSDRYYYEEIMFTDTLVGVQCDSIISYFLSVFDADTSYQEYNIIEGESITINNEEYSTAGEYVQSKTNDISCDSILLINIIIEDSNELPVPNVFTPNGDDINDEIIIYMEDYPINELLIFDRWGGLVFRSKNESIIQWDGKLNGSFISEGVYVFKLMYEDSNGDTQTQVGDITVIR